MDVCNTLQNIRTLVKLSSRWVRVNYFYKIYVYLAFLPNKLFHSLVFNVNVIYGQHHINNTNEKKTGLLGEAKSFIVL